MLSSASFDLEHMLAGFMRRAHFCDVFSLWAGARPPLVLVKAKMLSCVFECTFGPFS